jgi:23S rRNA (cytosine1962-C5)-methyltransferase
MKKIFLKPKKDAALRRFHPWVFSGAVRRTEGHPSDGELVEVYSHQGDFLGAGHYQHGSIRVRIISFTPTNADHDFWTGRLEQALQYRRSLKLSAEGRTDAYRLIHGEGDDLPGLIIDMYGRTAVLQCHSIGMHLERHKIAEALQAVCGNKLEAVYDKSRETLPGEYSATVENQYLFGGSETSTVLENGHRFIVDWEAGQKTGFFLDQRENRRLLAKYAPGKRLLNAYCYSGGFSVYALGAGASHVDSVDISGRAVELCRKNVEFLGDTAGPHEAYREDVLRFLQRESSPYDLIVVDPPAFAKSLKKRHNAVQGYKRLNAAALTKVKAGGILFTFSCSKVVDKTLFYHTVVAAALEARRKVKVMHQLSQAPDHPVSLYHPEGEYLKGLVLYID